MAANILQTILETKNQEVESLYREASLETWQARAAAAEPPRNFFTALTKPPRRRVNLIAEVKRASPSAGDIRADIDPAAVAKAYEAAGADAISVLTDSKYFHGCLDDLRAVRRAVHLPVLRKDFIIDPVQLYEARAAGADAVLLIAAAVTLGKLSDLMILAAELKMTVLLEVHDAGELLQVRSMIGFPRAAGSLLGVNNRDLTTFKVDMGTTLRLASMLEAGTPIVSESGIRTGDDVLRLSIAGIRAVLVGEALMRAGDVAAEVRNLLGPERIRHA